MAQRCVSCNKEIADGVEEPYHRSQAFCKGCGGDAFYGVVTPSRVVSDVLDTYEAGFRGRANTALGNAYEKGGKSKGVDHNPVTAAQAVVADYRERETEQAEEAEENRERAWKAEQKEGVRGKVADAEPTTTRKATQRRVTKEAVEETDPGHRGGRGVSDPTPTRERDRPQEREVFASGKPEGQSVSDLPKPPYLP